MDLLVLAGDIGRLRSTRNVSPLSYAQQAAVFLGCRVILVPGNHEYYRGSFDSDRAALLAAEMALSPSETETLARFNASMRPLSCCSILTTAGR